LPRRGAPAPGVPAAEAARECTQGVPAISPSMGDDTHCAPAVTVPGQGRDGRARTHRSTTESSEDTMSRTAPRIHVEQADIERLKALQLALDAELVVELHMRGGATLVGTLVDRPTVQQFRDAQGNEGTNGQVRIDLGDGDIRDLWLDEVERFTRLGSS